MPEIKEVHTYEHDSTSTSSALMVVILVFALIIVGLLAWQPWQAPGSDTTVITQPAPDIVNPPSNTTIVNPPAVNPPAEPPKTEINIETPPPPTGGGDNAGSSGN